MAMAESVSCDVVEQILVRSDVKDLIQWKRVCRSWYSLISSLYFVKSHLNYSCNNDLKQLPGHGHRRVARPTTLALDSFYNYFAYNIAGSSNGLVCLTSDDQILVANPLTAELKIVPYAPVRPLRGVSWNRCFGFGYDPCIDDYKVVAAIMEWWISPRERLDVPTSFLVFTLNASSAAWRIIGQVNYGSTRSGRDAVLCDGALHWFMRSYQNNRKVILSIDLSTEEFKEIPQPEELECNDDDHRLGVIQGCLCIYNHQSPASSNKWVYTKKQCWELFPCDYQIKNVVHYLRPPGDYTPMDNRCHGMYNSTAWELVRAPIYVQTLVSPHANNNMRRRTPTQTRNNNKTTSKALRYAYPKPLHFSHFSHTVYEWKRMRWNSKLSLLRIHHEQRRKNKIHHRWLREYGNDNKQGPDEK